MVKVGEQQNLDITEKIEVILMAIDSVFKCIAEGEISVT